MGDWRGASVAFWSSAGPLTPDTASAAGATRLVALTHAVPLRRQHAVAVAATLIRRGGRLGSLASALRQAMGGRHAMYRRTGASPEDALPKKALRHAGVLCASRVAAALDVGDTCRAEGWLLRWATSGGMRCE